MDLNASTIIGIAIGYVVTQLLRFAARSRFWSQVEANARRMLRDPDVPIDDARVAAERALLDQQQRQVARVAGKVSRDDRGDDVKPTDPAPQ